MSEISKFGRRYEREFKQKAIALVLGGRSQGEVSRDLGERCGKNRVARLMRAQGLRARQKRRFRPRTTDSRHGQRSPRNFEAQMFPHNQYNPTN